MGGGGGGFDADALRDELRAMMLPGQTLQLSVQRLSVMEDPALAVAFSSALRTATSPSLGPGGEVEARLSVYPRVYPRVFSRTCSLRLETFSFICDCLIIEYPVHNAEQRLTRVFFLIGRERYDGRVKAGF